MLHCWRPEWLTQAGICPGTYRDVRRLPASSAFSGVTATARGHYVSLCYAPAMTEERLAGILDKVNTMLSECHGTSECCDCPRPTSEGLCQGPGATTLASCIGMTMPLQLNEAEFAQQGSGNAELGNVVGLSILQLGHGEVSSSGWRVDGIIAHSALGQSILLRSFVSF